MSTQTEPDTVVVERQPWRELIDKAPAHHLLNAGHLAPHIVSLLPNERDKQWEVLSFCLGNTDTRPNKWMADVLDASIPYKKYVAPNKQKHFTKTQIKRLRNSSADQPYQLLLEVVPQTRLQEAEAKRRHKKSRRSSSRRHGY